jgi:hypothetical protein
MTVTQTQPHGNPRNFIRGTLTATNDALTLPLTVTGGAVGVQLDGTWSGTITFEATLNGTTWVALNLTPSNSTTPASTATANGAWGDANWGWKQVRARFSTATSGTVDVTINFTPSQF